MEILLLIVGQVAQVLVAQEKLPSSFCQVPPPPRPDFDASREKLQAPGEGEGGITKDEFSKRKQELEA